MNKRNRILFGVGLVVVVGGLLIYRALRSASQSEASTIQTAAVERGTLTATVDASGTLKAPQAATAAWRTSGIVGSNLVSLGDTVKAGDVLMELDPTSLDKTVIQAQADLITAQEDLADLRAGPTDLELAQAQLAVADAAQALEDAKYTWKVQQEGYRASSDTIAGAEAKLVIAQQEVDMAEQKYGEYSGRAEDDPARALALTRLTAARQSRDSAQRNLNWYTGHPTELQQAKLDADVAVAEAKLEDARATLKDLLDGPDPSDIAAAEARVAAAQATVDLARLVAPFDGTVVAISVQEGDSVSSGTSAVTLADISHFKVNVDVSEIDISRIAVGQETELSLDALSGKTFVGRVSDVAYMGSVSQGVVTYPVTVVVDNPDPELRPGMTAAVSIITDRREDVLIVPNRALKSSGGQRTVSVLFEGQQISVPVTLGLVGDTTSEVVEGSLKEGDTVVVNASSASSSQRFEGGPGGAFFIGGP
jgi:HlyD family secretion protein